jgi:NADPH:quinone reductase-like Zn-dependent oxidoreductase
MTLARKIWTAVLLLLLIGFGVGEYAFRHPPPPHPALVPGDPSRRMKAVVYYQYGSADVLKIVDVEKPAPADNEMLVKVHAASLNPYEWHFMTGKPYLVRMIAGWRAPKNYRLGIDFAGTVVAVGKSVTRYKVGDGIFGGADGALAEYVELKEDDPSTAPMPSNMSFDQAAAVAIAGATALQALRDKVAIHPGEKVLVNGASGGVGTFAVQIAKSFGAEVTGVCSTRNLELVRSLGADHVIDYTQDDFTRAGQHYDVIIDIVGSHSLLQYRHALTPTGTVVLVGGNTDDPWLGALDGPIRAVFLRPFVSQNFVLLLANVNKKGDMDNLRELMQSGKMTPVIDRRYPLAQVADAMRYLQLGHASGKVIVDID